MVLICSRDSEDSSNMFQIFCNGLVFESTTHFAFLLCYSNKKLFDTDKWMLLKHIYRVGRAANHQSNTDMNNYENRLLNEPITAIITAGYDNNFFSHLPCRASR